MRPPRFGNRLLPGAAAFVVVAVLALPLLDLTGQDVGSTPPTVGAGPIEPVPAPAEAPSRATPTVTMGRSLADRATAAPAPAAGPPAAAPAPAVADETRQLGDLLLRMSQACEAGEPVPEELIGELASLLKAHPRLGGTVVDAVRQGKDRMGALRPALIAAVLRTKDEKLRGALAEAFRATAPPTAAPVTNGEAHDLIARAASPDPALRRDALSRLGSMDGPAATALLTRAALTETDPAARTAAVRSLKGREGPEVSATFLRVLDDPLADAASRRFAATGLATCAGPQVTQTLARHAREAPDEGLRRNAINALARRNDDPLAVATLRAIFDDPATTVGLRRIVQAALVRAGDPAARAAMSVER